jgi:hypothetical protein
MAMISTTSDTKRGEVSRYSDEGTLLSIDSVSAEEKNHE